MTTEQDVARVYVQTIMELEDRIVRLIAERDELKDKLAAMLAGRTRKVV